MFTIVLFVFFQLYNHRSSLGAATMWLCGAVTACMKRTNQVSHNTFLVVVVVLFVVVVAVVKLLLMIS